MWSLTVMRFRKLAMYGAVLVAALTLCCAPTKAMAVESEPNLTEAQSAMVIDAQGNVLYEKNPDEKINMASVTKVMTAVVALESGVSLDTVCTLSAPALDENAMVAGYQSGDTSTLRDLLRAALVYSANDGAYEAAVAVAGSEQAFVQMMNDKAAELGMNNTHFENSHGLDAEGHHSTVHDLTILARYAMTKHPFIADTVRQTEVTVPIGGNNVTLPTVDTLLYSYPGLLGIKTGTGNHVTAFLGCARRNGVTLYTSVLGCQTKEGRFADTASLLDWAFDTYDAHSYATPRLREGSRTFAYNFAFSCVVSPDSYATGLSWPDGGEISCKRIVPRDRLFAPGDTVEVRQWTQGEHIVSTCSYSARNQLYRTVSGFGLNDTIFPWLSVTQAA